MRTAFESARPGDFVYYMREECREKSLWLLCNSETTQESLEFISRMATTTAATSWDRDLRLHNS